MEKIIAHCGLICNECSSFIATQKNDLDEKKKIAERWTNKYNLPCTPEEISCDGCHSNRLSAWCSRKCLIRPCAEKRKVKNCAYCNDYPCEKLKKFLSNEPEATKILENIRKTI